MKVLKKLVLFCFMILGILVLGDYLNLPLWPIDYLASNYPVQIKINLENVSSDLAREILSRSQHIHLSISHPDGQIVRTPSVDRRGDARIVLPRGRYVFNVSIPVVEKDDWYFLAYPPPESTDDFVKRIPYDDMSFSMSPVRVRDIPEDLLFRVLQMYFLEADFQSAMIFSSDMTETIRNDIEELLHIQDELAKHPVDAYNSILAHLNSAQQILSEYKVPTTQQTLIVDNQTVFIESRLEAVRKSRDRVIRDYLDLVQAFYESGRFVELFRQWNRLIQNTELLDQDMKLTDDILEKIDFYENVVSDYAALIPDEISRSFSRAVEVYETGNLMKARSAFVDLLSLIQDIKQLPEEEDTKNLIIEYIEDIELISEANYAIRMDQLERALFLYDSVSHPNDLVRERIAETERFMRLRGSR